MEEKTTQQKIATRKKIIALGAFLILFGVLIGIFTFLTVIGPILGLAVVIFGGLAIWRAVKAEKSPM